MPAEIKQTKLNLSGTIGTGSDYNARCDCRCDTNDYGLEVEPMKDGTDYQSNCNCRVW